MKTIAMMFAVLAVSGCSCHTVEPGERSVVVNWGKVEEPARGEGYQTACGGCDFHDISIRTQKKELDADCFSSDLQHLDIKFAVLFRIPEEQVINVFRQYHGEPFEVLIAPRAQESIKEATSGRTAEKIVKEREEVKKESIASLRRKISGLTADGGVGSPPLIVEDLIVIDVKLSKELSTAIEQKMVQQQEAAKAEFTKQKAEIDASIAVAKARGEADATLLRAEAEAKAIKIRGDALHQNPSVIELELINKWNGVSPEIVSGGNSGVTLLLPAARASPSTAGAK